MDLRMANIHPLIGSAFLALSIHAQAQKLDDAEVRISYGELKQLLSRAEPVATPKPTPPPPALLSARLRLSVDKGRPVINATFRTVSYGDEIALVPLIAGEITLDTSSPDDAIVITNDNSLCLSSDKPGTRALQLRLLPITNGHEFNITIPPCPSVIFETGELPADQSLVLRTENNEETLASGQVRPLSNIGESINIRLLGSNETREILSPPVPSTWSWQHQALVTPSEGDLVYHILARAAASEGSGVTALLPLPADAQDITVTGEDLISYGKIRGENRTLSLSLTWKNRGILDRQLLISYRMPLRPLDRTWKLQAPGDEHVRTRFIIATSPLLNYAAEGLSIPLLPQGLPAQLDNHLKGTTWQQLEAGLSAELTATPIPVAATEEGVVKNAEWSVKIEPDGSMLSIGNLTIEHKGPVGFAFDTPTGMKLLSCELDGLPVSPIDLGEGKLKVILSQDREKSQLTCSFTGTGTSLDAVDGTLKLSLPQTPLFIHSLLWNIDLPPGYQSETNGNLTRIAPAGGSPTRISLRKNLCRDERPEIQVFYQRADVVVKNAQWNVKIEQDGSLLTTGILTIEHKGPLGFVFDTPPDMKLLSCELSGRPASPIDLGEGKLKVTLPPDGESSQLVCSFTGNGNVLDPVEGTLKLSLPKTPFFIHTLLWQIDIPNGYQAETNGNLTRNANNAGTTSRISLQKNLCRDERPEIQVFYQRVDLNR